ncbi:hypothetical protein LTS18_012151, partial [Coniosporium uncinatum]
MPEVIRGVRSNSSTEDRGREISPGTAPSHEDQTTSPASNRRVNFDPLDSVVSPSTSRPDLVDTRRESDRRRKSSQYQRRASLPPELRPEEPEYHDSRAATVQEYRRRGTTLQEYYQSNPELLPQLPFTWHHGWKRWKLGILIFLIFIDACVVPIALYYGMAFGGDIEGW